MGARTDFIRAMLFGVVIGVAITTAFFQLRSDPAPAPGSAVIVAPPQQVTIEPLRDVPDAAVRTPLEQQMIARVAKVGVPVEVTCKSQCCAVSIDDAAYDEHADDIKAALELAPGKTWNSRKAGTVRVVEKCW